jgi:hypothetical protein
MQPLRVKSRKTGSRKRTCPKVDMPISRQVLRTLQRVRSGPGFTDAQKFGPWPSWPRNRPIRMVTVTDCAPSIDPGMGYSLTSELTHSRKSA